MGKTLLKFVSPIAVFALLVGGAAAAPLLWTLGGVTFSDGGTASGSFVYDADTNTFSNISITTTTGSVRNGASYSFNCTTPCTGLAPSSSEALTLTISPAQDQTGSPGFALFFSPDLSNVGGSRNVSGTEASCSDAGCSSPGGATRTVSAGLVTASIAAARAVPALSGLGLAAASLLLALAGIAGLKRRRLH